MARQILIKHIRGIYNFVLGDIRSVGYAEYKELKEAGIVEKTELLEDAYNPDDIEKDELKGVNILGEKYKKGVVDVVVPTMNRDEVKSLPVLKQKKQEGKITLEIIERKFSPEVGGFARACNDGARLNIGLGEFVLFLNDDVELGEGFFEDITKPFENVEVGMVGSDCSETSWGLNGSVMCIRRELLEVIGGFDENFFFMFEDNDLCENVKRRGFKIETSEARATHKGGESINTKSEFWRKNYYTGLDYYNRKWRDNKRIIATMIVGDENDRYMSRAIIDLFKRNLIDEIVVVCDHSNKETIEELKQLQKFYLVDIKINNFKLFGKAENLLRERAVQYAISKNPFGIVVIDADEFFDEELTRDVIINLLVSGVAYDFLIAHFWGDEESVRVDGVFAHQQNIRIFRHSPEQSQKFFDRNLHCGSAPMFAYAVRKETDFVVKHFGYVRERDVIAKKERQEKYDPKMLLENPDLYNRMMKEGEVIKFNKLTFLEIWKK